MDCQHVQDRMNDYFDRDLSPEEENAFEEHLLACPSCKKVFEDMESVLSLVRESALLERLPSREFFEQVFTRAATGMAPSPRTDSDPTRETSYSTGLFLFGCCLFC